MTVNVKNALLIGLGVGSIAGALVVGSIESAEAAPTDKVAVVMGATARVTYLCIAREPDDSLAVTARGEVQVDGGEPLAKVVRWKLAGAAETAARNFLDGPAATRWRSEHGLEK